MKRRDFVKQIAGGSVAVAAGVMGSTSTRPPLTLGRPDYHLKNVRFYINGIDVTALSVTYASERRGCLRVYSVDPEHGWVMNPKRWLRGHVAIVMNAKRSEAESEVDQLLEVSPHRITTERDKARLAVWGTLQAQGLV